MATYSYRCPEHGVSDALHPIGTAPTSQRCPDCGARSARVFTAPRLATLGANRHRAMDLAGGSAERPEVTTRIPATAAAVRGARRPPGRGSDPRHAQLPRP